MTKTFIYPANTDHDNGGYPHRLRRSDSRNIVLQKKQPHGWVTIAYCGNSARAILRALNELVISHHRPDGAATLVQQLDNLAEAIRAGSEAIREAITNEY